MKRLLIYLLIALAAVIAVGLFLIYNPRIGTQLFFDQNFWPVEITFKQSYRVPTADEKTRAAVAAANGFLDSLDDTQRRKVSYAFTDNEQRSNWSNFPEGMVPRGGLMIGELSAGQMDNLDKLIAVLFSEKGVKNIAYQSMAEDMLVADDRLGLMKYGSDYLSVAFLGTPSAREPWMFQFGGHHLALNVTVFGPHVSFSPMLTGGEPLHVTIGVEDVILTREEVVAAHALLDSLMNVQKELAVRGAEAIDLVFGPGQYGKFVYPEGIKGSDLTAKQKELLVAVVAERLGFLNEDDYAEKMEVILAEIDDTFFGWWGPELPLGAGYFRISGPSILLEYSPQNGTQGLDHVHSIYRNPKNDYGSAWIGSEN